ncbi:hypothetical protein NXF25_002491 [Crotalus adamanteus]|uniref:Uncharacterized protein n=1 Tax=Crotalus adamanteus TaxID=8729 RepID=A0AAW1C9Y3_CROAD
MIQPVYKEPRPNW